MLSHDCLKLKTGMMIELRNCNTDKQLIHFLHSIARSIAQAEIEVVAERNNITGLIVGMRIEKRGKDGSENPAML